MAPHLSTRSDNDGTFDIVAPPVGIFLEQVLAGGDKWRSGVTSTVRPTADPGGMVLRRFDNECVCTDTCLMV